jgi:hypothetical protein
VNIVSELHVRPRKDMLIDMTGTPCALVRNLFVIPF